MKKLLLLVSALALTLGLSACNLGKEVVEDLLSDITLSGVVDVEIEAETPFNVYTGITAMGDDDVDYSSFITAESETCVIAANGDVDTSTAKTCIIVYTVLAEGILDRTEMTLRITPIQIDIGDAPLLMDWDFQSEADLVGWEIYVAGTGAIDMSVEDGAMKLVTVSGGLQYETRLDYMNIPFEMGYDYKVSFMMKSSIDAKKVHLNLGELLPAAPWFTPFKPENVDVITLTTDWVEYSYTFNMATDNTRGGIIFEMGNITDSEGLDATMWIKDLKIEGGSGTDTAAPAISGANDVILMVGDAFDATAGVMANDVTDGDLTSSIVVGGDTVDTAVEGSYSVTYTVSDAAGNEAMVTRVVDVVTFALDPNNNDRANNIFLTDSEIGDTMTNPWYKSVSWGQPIFTANVVSGKLVMSSAKDGDKDYGTAPWDHIVRWTEMILVEGAVYKVVVDLSTDETGLAMDVEQMMLKVEAGAFAAETRFHVGETPGTVEFMFKYTGESTIAGSLLFFVGGREHVITAENLMIYVNPTGQITDTDPMIAGAMDAMVLADATVDLLEGVTASDVEDGVIALTAANVTVVGPAAETVFDSSVAGDWVVTYSVTDADGNTTTEEVTITVMDFSTEPVLAYWSFATAADLDGWVFDAQGGQTIEGSHDVDALKLVYTNGGNTWEPRLVLQGLPLENTYTYMVSFMAKSEQDGKVVHLQVGEILSGAPWFTNFDENSVYVTLGTDWAEYFFIFTMPIENQNGGLLFELGNIAGEAAIGGTIWLKDIKVMGGSGIDSSAPMLSGVEDAILEVGTAFDPTTDVMANDFVDGDLTASIVVTGDTVDVNTAGSYTVTYTVTDAAGNVATVDRVVQIVGYVTDTNNTDVLDIFATDTTIDYTDTNQWYLVTGWGAPDFTAASVSGELTITHIRDGVADFGGNFWDDMVFASGWRLVQGATYKVSFEAKRTVTEGTQGFLFKMEGPGFAAEKWMDDITDSYLPYELVFEYTGATTVDGLAIIFVGGNEQVVNIQNMTVEMIETDLVMHNPVLEAPALTVYSTTDTPDLDAIPTAFDIEDGVLVPTYTVVGPNAETVFDAAVEGLWTVTYTATDSDANVVTVTVQVMIGDFEATTILTNYDFEVDTAGWTFTGNANDLTMAWGEASVHWTDAGANPWDVKAEAQGLVFEDGATYMITFDARATADRNFAITLWDPTASTVVYTSGDLAITAAGNSAYEWTKGAYTLVFTFNGSNPVNFEFQVGNFGMDGGTRFDFDNVIITKLVEGTTE